MGEHAHTFVQLSHPPNITSPNFRANLVAKLMGCQMHVLPRPPSSCFANPPYYTILCSSIPDSTLVVSEDQAIDGVGVAQPTCVVIKKEYDCELENQPTTKDDSLPSAPPPFFPDIFGDFAISDFACISLSTDAPIVDHS